ncbi:ABC transporter ATP-binding protein [Streptomyces sp. WM6373]|uniref:ATP-binding cassette domain-containing protein n=1 Tax=Streptomyces TaxID=1883 RepID=UPI0006B04F85|nr:MULTISPECIES: ABC transporter ATP-binding protein [unclassified Streptomyces]KOU31356.1 ABC transporter ATP-binding protein [Streptomyces sp. WM6373]KOU60062.1 ABC transporter ATP-binding protein [Streptomyces sp. IGB124]KOU96239.1 ABC transporter ATP-binding protein [Streptomyces sp. XY58]KOV11809.1 ABC transporter ATP-binding protein [Streptomyces sp. XY37]KOV14264.1 ABC transporter ATP-binding protein [Streptomyces sp. XY413]
MLQAIGLTSKPRTDAPPLVDDLTFEARPGHVTALLGEPGSGKTTALRLMLELEPGRGVTYFRGRPLHRIPHPGREVGVLLGDVPGNPARTVRNQLRMLCAAAGVPASRADTMLEVVGIAGLRDQRLGSLSLGMERRVALASALLGDPCTLLLDEPAAGLSPRERGWLYGLLRGHASLGGAVLFTTDDAKEAARSADRVVSIEAGRLVADQEAADFARTRLRPRVAVRTPHAARLADVLGREARAARRAVEIVEESGSRLSVYGSNCAEVGEAAFRHGVLVHQLADETGDAGASTAPVPHARAAATATTAPAGAAPNPSADSGGRPGDARSRRPASAVRRVGGPLRPLRYELLRVFGTATPVLTTTLVVVASVLTSLVLARAGQTPQNRLLAAWPELLPLPPAALGAGLLGALAFGEEYRYPALAADRGTVPRRLGLLTAKLGVCAALALLLGTLVVTADAAALALVFDSGPLRTPTEWLSPAASWAGLLIGCAWAGVLASGVFRSATAGLAAVLAVPVGVVPLVRKALEGSSAYPVTGLGPRLRGLSWVQWPPEADRLLVGALRVMTQPVATALVLSLMVLLCAYGFTGLRSRVRW